VCNQGSLCHRKSLFFGFFRFGCFGLIDWGFLRTEGVVQLFWYQKYVVGINYRGTGWRTIVQKSSEFKPYLSVFWGVVLIGVVGGGWNWYEEDRLCLLVVLMYEFPENRAKMRLKAMKEMCKNWAGFGFKSTDFLNFSGWLVRLGWLRVR